MFTSLRIFDWVSWQEVREKETGRKAATRVMNFREPSTHAAAPPSLPSSPPTQSGGKICGLCPELNVIPTSEEEGRMNPDVNGGLTPYWRFFNFLCFIDNNDVTTRAVAMPTSALAAIICLFFECHRQIRWITTERFSTHMSYFNVDVVRIFFFLLFSQRCSQCGTRLFAPLRITYSWKMSTETKGFFLELCAHEKVKIPCFNWHLEDLRAFLCYGVIPAQCSAQLNLVLNLKFLWFR